MASCVAAVLVIAFVLLFTVALSALAHVDVFGIDPKDIPPWGIE
jgi:predicted Co/Zn/Cd cation transporter (cation efflux family)